MAHCIFYLSFHDSTILRHSNDTIAHAFYAFAHKESRDARK